MLLKIMAILFAIEALSSVSFEETCKANSGEISSGLRNSNAKLYYANTDIFDTIAFDGTFRGKGRYADTFGALSVDGKKLTRTVVKIGKDAKANKLKKDDIRCKAYYNQQWLSRFLPEIVFEMKNVHVLEFPQPPEVIWCMGQMPLADGVFSMPFPFLEKSSAAFYKFFTDQKIGDLKSGIDFWKGVFGGKKIPEIDFFKLLGEDFFEENFGEDNYLSQEGRKTNSERIESIMEKFSEDILKEIISKDKDKKLNTQEFKDAYELLKNDWLQTILILEDAMYKIVLLHKNGIAHNDLNSGNILLKKEVPSKNGREWSVKLHDFDLMVDVVNTKPRWTDNVWASDQMDLMDIIKAVCDNNGHNLPFKLSINKESVLMKRVFSVDAMPMTIITKKMGSRVLFPYNHEAELACSSQNLKEQQISYQLITHFNSILKEPLLPKLGTTPDKETKPVIPSTNPLGLQTIKIFPAHEYMEKTEDSMQIAEPESQLEKYTHCDPDIQTECDRIIKEREDNTKLVLDFINNKGGNSLVFPTEANSPQQTALTQQTKPAFKLTLFPAFEPTNDYDFDSLAKKIESTDTGVPKGTELRIRKLAKDQVAENANAQNSKLAEHVDDEIASKDLVGQIVI